jgi:hypothetical protein
MMMMMMMMMMVMMMMRRMVRPACRQVKQAMTRELDGLKPERDQLLDQALVGAHNHAEPAGR